MNKRKTIDAYQVRSSGKMQQHTVAGHGNQPNDRPTSLTMVLNKTVHPVGINLGGTHTNNKNSATESNDMGNNNITGSTYAFINT